MKCCAKKDLRICLLALCGIALGSVTFTYFALSSTCCTELKTECLSCLTGTPAYEFCWKNSGWYDCGYRILVAITTHEERGHVKFISSIARNYLHLRDKDVIVYDNNSKTFGKNDLYDWFGNQTKLVRSENRLSLNQIHHEVLQLFVKSDHDVLLIINSHAILHNDWRDFVNAHIDKAGGVLSLYQSADESAPKTEDAGTFSEVSSLPEFGIAVKKHIAKRILDDEKISGDSSIGQALHKVSGGMLAPPRSLILPYGKHRNEATANNSVPHVYLKPCHFPPWIKEGIEFFNDIYTGAGETYVEKDSLPRKDGHAVKRIGVLLISSSMSAVETYLKSILPTLERVYRYKLYLQVSGESDSAITVIEDNLRRILYADMEFQIVPFNRNKFFSGNMNLLFRLAYADGLDYFLHVPETEHSKFEEGWTTCAIEQIISREPPNVGVATTPCKFTKNSSVATAFVSRLHYDVFGVFYPPTLSEKDSLLWISGVYNQIIFHSQDGSDNTRIPSLEDQIVRGYVILNKWSRPVVSYSLYGSNKRYTDGAIANMKLMPKYFSGWQMWVYHDNSVPVDVLAELCQNGVKLIDMTGFPVRNHMSWRFLVASEPVKRFIVRDIDSRLSKRDRAAVDEWVSSGKKFHTIRDHPNHSLYSMNGGMWGAIYGAVPNMKALLLRKNPSGRYLQDMNFLNNVIWYNYGKYSVMQHDEVSERRFGRTRPFPLPPEGTEFVGDVYIDGKQVE